MNEERLADLVGRQNDQAQALGFMSVQHLLDCMAREAPNFYTVGGEPHMVRYARVAGMDAEALARMQPDAPEGDETDGSRSCSELAAKGPQVGDVVQLKSGGPKMTVRYIIQECCGVEWFDAGDLREMEFDYRTLATTTWSLDEENPF